jgi:hypothetical protein
VSKKGPKHIIVTFGPGNQPVTKGEWGCLIVVATAFLLFCTFHFFNSLYTGKFKPPTPAVPTKQQVDDPTVYPKKQHR